MSLDTVKARVDEDVMRAIEGLRAKAAQDMAQIEKETQDSIARMRAEHEHVSEAILARMQTKEKLTTQLITKKILLTARRDAIHDAFLAARSAVHGDTDRYDAFLRTRVIESLEAIDVRIIHCAPEEGERIARVFNDAGRNVEYQEHAHLHGGFIAETRDHRVRLDATLATVFEGIQRDSQSDVMRILWPRKEAPTSMTDGPATATAIVSVYDIPLVVEETHGTREEEEKREEEITQAEKESGEPAGAAQDKEDQEGMP